MFQASVSEFSITQSINQTMKTPNATFFSIILILWSKTLTFSLKSSIRKKIKLRNVRKYKKKKQNRSKP